MAILPKGSYNEETDPSVFEPVPAGVYTVMVTDSELKDTAKEDGKYLKLTFRIVEGDYAGRLLWTNLNLVNPNPTAVEIANRELARLRIACGLDQIEDSQELHGIPISATVTVRPAQGQWPASNAISNFNSLD